MGAVYKCPSDDVHTPGCKGMNTVKMISADPVTTRRCLWCMAIHPHLNGVNVVCNDHQLCLLLLHQRCHMVDAVFDHWWWFLAHRGAIPFSSLRCFLLQSVLLLQLGLRSVLVQQTKELGSWPKRAEGKRIQVRLVGKKSHFHKRWLALMRST